VIVVRMGQHDPAQPPDAMPAKGGEQVTFGCPAIDENVPALASPDQDGIGLPDVHHYERGTCRDRPYGDDDCQRERSQHDAPST
jgi:hypothetical protein